VPSRLSSFTDSATLSWIVIEESRDTILRLCGLSGSSTPITVDSGCSPREFRIFSGRQRLALLDIRLINEVFLWNDQVGSFNNDLEDLMATYYELREGFLAGHVGREEFVAAATRIGEDLETIRREAEALQPEAERLHAWIRLQAKRDTPRMWIAVNTPRVARVTDDQIRSEVATLQSEMQRAAAAGRERIARVHPAGPAGQQG